MNDYFETCFNYLILKDESSKFVNNPHDSGGPTKWGITKKTYEEFFHVEATIDDIKNMTAATAKQIYTGLFWIPLSCGQVRDLGIVCALFDSSVLYGVRTVSMMAQRALKKCAVEVKLDGIFGDKSAEALNQLLGSAADNRKIFLQVFQNLILERIDDVIVACPVDEDFRIGWTNRAHRLSQLLDEGYLNQFKEEIFP